MHHHRYTPLLLILSIFIAAVIETDIYLPSFPDMMIYFSQTESHIQKILTWNFIGLCLSGPIYGPFSDAYGRRIPLLMALSLFFGGSLITSMSDHFNFLLIGRFLQGLGSGGCFTLGTAIIFDSYTEEKALQTLNKINTLVPFLMVSAPLLGGYLNEKFGFKANFYVIAFNVLLSLIFCWSCFREPLKPEHRTKLQIKAIFKTFKGILKQSNFIRLTFIVSLSFAGFLCFLSTTAVLFVTQLDISKSDYPYYQGSLLLSYLGASICGTRLINTFGLSLLKYIGLFLLVLASVLLLLATFLKPLSPLWLTVAMSPYGAGFAWLQTPYISELMKINPESKGSVASLLTSIRLILTAAVIEGTSHFYNGTIVPTTLAVVLSSAIIVLFVYFQNKLKSEDD